MHEVLKYLFLFCYFGPEVYLNFMYRIDLVTRVRYKVDMKVG